MSDIPKASGARFTVYGVGLSPYVRKVRVVLAEKNVPYENVPVNVMAAPEWFAEVSPLKRIPALHDAAAPSPGFLADSAVICAYLERQLPAPALMPEEDWAAARVLWLQEYTGAMMGRLGPEVFRQRVLAKLFGSACDEAVVQKCLTEVLPAYFTYLEAALGGAEFFVGGTLSLADIAIAAAFVNFHHAGERVDAARYPHLSAFIARMHARPSFAALIAEEEAMVARFRG